MNDEIDQHPTISAGRDDYSRLLLGSADDALEFDAQGRVVIPVSLRNLAKIEVDSNVLLVGCGNRLEIWPPKEYAKFQSDREGYNRDRRLEFETAYKRMVGGE
jgi:DNA-binding transcriptional regulator/RsmH inhibitor MraZ